LDTVKDYVKGPQVIELRIGPYTVDENMSHKHFTDRVEMLISRNNVQVRVCYMY
jgi:hypothetical protein